MFYYAVFTYEPWEIWWDTKQTDLKMCVSDIETKETFFERLAIDRAGQELEYATFGDDLDQVVNEIEVSL